MKGCNNCKHQNRLDIDGLTDCPFKKICATDWMRMYSRKRRLWFAFWIPKVLLITLALILGGCSHTEATYKDGVATVKRTRILMTEDIGSFSYDATDGSFTLDGYKSDMTQALRLIEKLTMKDEKKAVKP